MHNCDFQRGSRHQLCRRGASSFQSGRSEDIHLCILRSGKFGYGFNFAKEEYVMMAEAGILDPTKVTRSALENASSVAAMVLTTESLVADKPDPAADGTFQIFSEYQKRSVCGWNPCGNLSSASECRPRPVPWVCHG